MGAYFILRSAATKDLALVTASDSIARPFVAALLRVN